MRRCRGGPSAACPPSRGVFAVRWWARAIAPCPPYGSRACNSIRNSARYISRRRIHRGGMAHDHAHHDHSHAHDHSHGHAGHSHAPDNFGWAFAIGAALNTAFVIAELIFGYAANSLALISDAVHNLSDVIALLLAWGAAWLAQKQPTQRHTYGYRRASILAALFNAGLLLVAVGGIVVEAVNRLWRACAGRGLDRRAGRGARRRHQRRHRAVVHARPSRRPQYSRRLSAHGGRCGRFARRGGRGAASSC